MRPAKVPVVALQESPGHGEVTDDVAIRGEHLATGPSASPLMR
jgi:hypothetical protein